MNSGECIKFAAEISGLTVCYDGAPVLWDIDLNIPKGRLVALIGPNGAGKSTFIKAVLGLVKPVSGTVRFFEGASFKKCSIGYVPQSESVDWDFPITVEELVMMGRYGHLGWVKRPGKNDRKIADEAIRRVGLCEFKSRQISRLSGGQQQRAFLARAIAQQPEIYFLDEPFRGVDAQTEKEVVGLLKELKAQGKTIVAVHHDLSTVTEYFDWVALVNLELIACGPAKEVFCRENLMRTYRLVNC